MACRRCGCEERKHRHMHDRDYCGTCGPDVCNGYLPPRRRGLIGRLLQWGP